MKAAQLRQSILQAAVQGKLVPQNVHDEPAFELLKRIQQEKSQLIKDGKIKKEKPLSPIAEDEIPYDLPDGWVWCRLGDAVSIKSSKRIFESDYVTEGIPFYRSKEIGDLARGESIKSKFYITNEKYEDIKKRFGAPQKGDILITSVGTIGNCWVSDGRDFYYKDGNVTQILATKNIASDYLLLYLRAPLFFLQAIGTVAGTAYSALTIIKFNNVCFPLPSLAEQQRIVAKVEELMTLCDELEAAEKELDVLESRFAEYLPKSILQAAVQGKLVPQNVYDEPASKLLKRIQQEKAQLIKEGKLKKEKPLPPITEDEIPYDLPNGWIWSRLGEVITLISGRDLDTKDFNGEECGIPYITGASAIENNSILVNRWTDVPIVVSLQNDLLLSCKGTVGKLVFNDIGDCHIARQIMAIRMFSNQLSKEFIRLFLSSHVDQLAMQAKSMIPGISRDNVLNAIMTLPPRAEQQRIVAKVDELMALCDELKTAKDIPVKQTTSHVVPFPQQSADEPKIGIAARGEMQEISDEAARDIKEMFGDDGNA